MNYNCGFSSRTPHFNFFFFKKLKRCLGKVQLALRKDLVSFVCRCLLVSALICRDFCVPTGATICHACEKFWRWIYKKQSLLSIAVNKQVICLAYGEFVCVYVCVSGRLIVYWFSGICSCYGNPMTMNQAVLYFTPERGRERAGKERKRSEYGVKKEL